MNVYSLVSTSFVLETVLFLLFLCTSLGVGVAFTTWLLPTKRDISAAVEIVLALVLSIILLTGLGYLFGYLQVRWLSWGFVALGGVWLYIHRQQLLQLFHKLYSEVWKADHISLAIGAIGVASQLLAVIASGFRHEQGIIYHRLNGVDGLLHLGFAEFMKEHFPPIQPGAVDLLVTNYHYWSDLYIAEISRLFLISVNHLYFHFLPVVIGIALPVLLVKLIRILKGSVHVERWALFFHFFAGNAAYLFAQYFTGSWGWHLPAIDHGVLQFFNMPQAFARLIFIAGLLFFMWFIEKKRLRHGLAMVLLFASLFGFKVYWGIFAVIGYTLYLLYWFVIQLYQAITAKGKVFSQQLYQHLITYTVFGVTSLAIFLPTNKDAGGLFLAPFAWPKLLLGAQNLNWNEWWLRLQVYQAAGNTKALVVWFGLATAVFLLAMYGTRLLGLIPPIHWFKQKANHPMLLFLWPTAVIFTVLGMNVLQASGGANVFNFFILALFSAGVLLPFNLDWLREHIPKPVYLIVTASIIVLSIPRPMQDLYLFIRSTVSHEEGFVISPEEEEALNYLKNNTDPEAAVQAHNHLRHDNFETPYVSLFSERQSYMAGSNILLSHNQPVEDRIDEVQHLFSIDSNARLAQKMSDLGIDYLYLKNTPEQVLPKNATAGAKLKVVFENDAVTIWKRTDQ